jgi:hypothetical protein
MGIGSIIGGAAEAARRAAEAAKRAAEAAAKKAAEAAAKKAAEAAAKAKQAKEQIESVAKNRTQDVFERGKGLVEGARDLKQQVRETTGDVFEGVKSTAGSALRDTVQKAGPVLDTATDIAAGGLDKLGQAIQDAPAPNPLQGITQDIAGGVLQGAADVVRDPVETAGEIKQALSLNHQVDQLKPGESVSVGLNGEADVSGVGVTAKGDLAVSRSAEEGGGYTVSVSGEVGAGVIAKLGAKGAADASASAFATAGAKVEFQFDTAEEAKRATKIIAASAATAGASASNPLLGQGVNQVLGDPLSDLAGLGDKVSAVELQLGAEAGVSGELGMKGLPEVLSAGASAGVSANQGTTARIEMENGQPKSLKLTQSLEISGNAGASAGLGIPSQGEGGTSASLPTNASAGVQGSLKVELEQSIDLPENFNPADFLKDPKGTAREVGQTALQTHEAKLTLTDSRQGSAQALGLGGSAGREVKAEISGNLQDIARSGAFSSIANGDVGQAVTQLRDKVDIKATVQDKTTVNGDIGVGVHAGVGGGEVGLTTERTHVGEERELNAAQLAELYLTQRWSAGIPG